MASSPVADEPQERPLWEFTLVEGLDEQAITVGFFSQDVAQRAAFNEFGTEHIPSRPFMRTTFDGNVRKYQDMARRRVGVAIDGKTAPATVLVPIANQMRNDLIRSIQQWSDPPNSPETVRDKGAANPLVDTGEMMRSVEIKVLGPGQGRSS